MRPDALGALISNDTVIDINMCLVDAETGIVKALKTLRLSEDFSEALLQIVELQARSRFDPWAYLDTVEKAAIDYQNERVVVAESIVMCSPGLRPTVGGRSRRQGASISVAAYLSRRTRRSRTAT